MIRSFQSNVELGGRSAYMWVFTVLVFVCYSFTLQQTGCVYGQEPQCIVYVVIGLMCDHYFRGDRDWIALKMEFTNIWRMDYYWKDPGEKWGWIINQWTSRELHQFALHSRWILWILWNERWVHPWPHHSRCKGRETVGSTRKRPEDNPRRSSRKSRNQLCQ